MQEPVRRLLSGIGNVHLIEPLDYLPLVYLMHPPAQSAALAAWRGATRRRPVIGRHGRTIR